MIIAHVTHQQRNIPVRVLDAWTSTDGRSLAVVETLDGSQPFTLFTHGGPADYDSAVVRVEFLHDVVVSADAPQVDIYLPAEAAL